MNYEATAVCALANDHARCCGFGADGTPCACECHRAIPVTFDGKARVHAEGAAARMIENQARGVFREGSVVESQLTGDRYRLENVRPGRVATLRRAEPKIKGKAARKAHKRANRGRGWQP